MYDSNELLDLLTTDDIIRLLQKLGDVNIVDERDKGQLVMNTICHNEAGGSHKLYYLLDRKKFHCFTGCDSLSLYDLVIQRHALKGVSMDFKSALEWVAVESGNGFSFSSEPLSQSVNEEIAWMRKFNKTRPNPPEPDKLSEYLLMVFSYHQKHTEFTNDNILPSAMDRFNIRMDWGNNALVIPHRYHKDGRLIGLMSRNLNPDSVARGFKYVPTIVQDRQFSFPKHINLYGLWENKSVIQKMKKAAIFESEKSVLQCESYFGEENNFAVALGGKHISNEQVEILLELGVEEVILNFDKDFEDTKSPEAQRVMQHIIQMGRKLTPYMRVHTTFDRYDFLEKNDSPSDKGREVLIQLFNKKEEIRNVS